jgi:hypothetical protein
MSVEDLVDDFWREALLAKLGGHEAQTKWNGFIAGLAKRVERFPQAAQDEVFRRAALHNAHCIQIAQGDLNALRQKLGVPDEENGLSRVAAEALVRATVCQGVGSLFRLFR